MPYSPRVKALAYSKDPECWISYSGWDADVKRALDARRNAALEWAAGKIMFIPGHVSNEEIRKLHFPIVGRKPLHMNVITLEVMLHCFYACEQFHLPNSEAYRRALHRLLAEKMIEPTTELERSRATGWDYKATEKGRVYVHALVATPLPVQSKPEWVMPNA